MQLHDIVAKMGESCLYASDISATRLNLSGFGSFIQL